MHVFPSGHFTLLHAPCPPLFLYMPNCSPYTEEYWRDLLGALGLAAFIHVPELNSRLSFVSLWILFLLPVEFRETHCYSSIDRQLLVLAVLIIVLHFDWRTFIISRSFLTLKSPQKYLYKGLINHQMIRWIGCRSTKQLIDWFSSSFCH